MLSIRFLTGFFLAGIYPVGMKIADYFNKGLGKSLIFSGRLSIRHCFSAFTKRNNRCIPMKLVILTTSSLALLGGLMIVFLVPNGPYRKQSQGINLSALIGVFENQNLRSAALDILGTCGVIRFWAFTPLMLQTYNDLHPETTFNIPILSFLIIGIGGLLGIEWLPSQTFGAKRIAFTSLFCLALSCFSFSICRSVSNAVSCFLAFLGMVVVADSPLLSTLVAQNAQQK
jgi:hypothetical protein